MRMNGRDDQVIDVEHTAVPARQEYVYARADCRCMHVLDVGGMTVAASNVGGGGRSSRPWIAQTSTKVQWVA